MDCIISKLNLENFSYFFLFKFFSSGNVISFANVYVLRISKFSPVNFLQLFYYIPLGATIRYQPAVRNTKIYNKISGALQFNYKSVFFLPIYFLFIYILQEVVSFIRSFVVPEGFPDSVTPSFVPYMSWRALKVMSIKLHYLIFLLK